ncbi:MAG TPA: hypothetical protein VMW30_07035 [Candidatus Paceibacterota bacterium]|nr:hypothetical protein [Candidatus Paceibacterota bacterium]
MKTKSNFLLAFGSALLGGFMTFALTSSLPSASAATGTSGYYVCANKITSALKMSPTSGKCAKTEFKYFLLSDVTDSGSTISRQNTADITYLATGYSCDSGAISQYSSVNYVSRVSYNQYSNYSPIDVSTSHLLSCRMTVNVP